LPDVTAEFERELLRIVEALKGDGGAMEHDASATKVASLHRRYAPAIEFARMIRREQASGGIMQPQRRTLENG
jgi:hypothetical protein